MTEVIETEEVVTPAPPGFAVTDDRSADWVLRKVGEARAAAANAKAWADEIAERAKKDEAQLLARFGPELERYATQRLTGSDRKSFKLPSGALGYRTVPDRITVENESEAIKWAETRGIDAVSYKLEATGGGGDNKALNIAAEVLAAHDIGSTITTRPVVAELNDYFKRTGDIPDGCAYQPAVEKFFVK